LEKIILLEEERQIVDEIVNASIEGYRNAIAAYWPSNSVDKGRPGEITMGHYLSHALINKGYMVYSEASLADTGAKKSDLLAISGSKNHYILFELKTPTTWTVSAVTKDVERAANFRLNTYAGNQHKVGSQRMETVTNCKRGTGVVCVLWDIDTREPTERNEKGISAFRDVVRVHSGWASAPMWFLNHTSDRGSYWFQYAVVPGLRNT
jgi:hypothetical protein